MSEVLNRVHDQDSCPDTNDDDLPADGSTSEGGMARGQKREGVGLHFSSTETLSRGEPPAGTARVRCRSHDAPLATALGRCAAYVSHRTRTDLTSQDSIRRGELSHPRACLETSFSFLLSYLSTSIEI